jgi:hypothetical protein
MAKEIKRASAAATHQLTRKLSLRYKTKSLELKEDSLGTDDDMSDNDAEVAEMKRQERLETIMTEEIAELEKDEIEMFDQYLEIIMTFGYITMFASAFPFGATLTSLFVYLETKNDMYSLTKLTRRPFVCKTMNIGVWEYTLDFFTTVSIFTNIWLCCYASN